MKKAAWILALALAASGSAFAQEARKDGDKKVTAQQQRMKSCNAEAGDRKLKGDARKSFMSECLSADAPKPTAQQEKMKVCNQQASAKNMKGEERRKFMSGCLSG
jgi:uncharacterized protein HemX